MKLWINLSKNIKTKKIKILELFGSSSDNYDEKFILSDLYK